MRPYFTIIIAAYNEGRWLKYTVDSILENSEYPHYEIIVVDDGSSDRSFEFLKRRKYQGLIDGKKITSLRSLSHGIARARNEGAKAASGEILIFIDAHMKISKGWLRDIRKTILRRPEIHILGIHVYDMADDIPSARPHTRVYTNDDLSMLRPHWIRSADTTVAGIKRVPYVNGGCFIIRKAVFDYLKGFPGFIEGWGLEDRSMCLLAYYFGYNTYLTGRIRIGHRFKNTKAEQRITLARKKRVLYNSLAACYVLYDREYYGRAVSALRTGHNLRRALNEFEDNKSTLDRYRGWIARNRKRTLQEFIDDFEDLLPFFKISDYFRAKEIGFDDPPTAIRLLENAGKLNCWFGNHDKKAFLATVNYDLALLYFERDIKKSSLYIEEALRHSATFIPILVLAAYRDIMQDRYAHALMYLHGALSLHDTKVEKYYSNRYHSDCRKDLMKSIYENLSLAHYYDGDLKLAIKYVNVALKISPADRKLKANRAIYLDSRRNWHQHYHEHLRYIE